MIPRELNTQADFISKLRDCNDRLPVTYFNNWIVHGGHVPWIVLLPFIMQKLSDFFAVLEPRLPWGRRVFPAMDWRKLPFSSARKYCYEGS